MEEFFPPNGAAEGLFDDGGEMDVEDAETSAAQEIQETLKTCLVKFATKDFIMEPEIFSQLKKYFQAGGNPEHVIDLLSANYIAVAQMANLMAEWPYRPYNSWWRTICMT